jgi:APA family basic amino acid/polyamine antiporter
MSTSTPPEAPQLRRTLGLFQVSLAGVGIILGAGVYVLIGAAAGEAGSLTWLSFLIAAAVTAATGLSYAELSGMFPRAGAGYEYTRQAFGMRIAFLTGWLTISAEVVAAAAVALGFGSYFEALTGLDSGIAAIVLLGVGTFVAASGALGSVALAGFLTLVEVGGLIFVTSVGFVDFDPSRIVGASDTWAVLSGSALVFFAYIGFEDIATFSEEARDPRRTVPRAILISIVVTTVLYVLVAISAVGAIGAPALAASGAPLADVAARVLGQSAGDVLAVVALAATGNTALLLLMASCRRIYAMASTGALPAFLARVSGGSGIPISGLIPVGVVAALITLWGDIGQVADITNFALFVAFVFVNAAVIELRRREPGLARSFRTPGTFPAIGARRRGTWIPLLPVFGIVTTVLLIANLDRTSLVGGMVVMAIGVVLLALRGTWAREDDDPEDEPPATSSQTDRVEPL